MLIAYHVIIHIHNLFWTKTAIQTKHTSLKQSSAVIFILLMEKYYYYNYYYFLE